MVGWHGRRPRFRRRGAMRASSPATRGLATCCFASRTSNVRSASTKTFLGFRVTDYVATNYNGLNARFVFMRANERHHTLAVGTLPVPKRLLHFMLQCRELDDVGRALDRVPTSGLRQTRSLGRHVNDKMLSFYMETPSKVQVEYGFGGLEIGETSTWAVTTYDVTSVWGHRHL